MSDSLLGNLVPYKLVLLLSMDVMMIVEMEVVRASLLSLLLKSEPRRFLSLLHFLISFILDIFLIRFRNFIMIGVGEIFCFLEVQFPASSLSSLSREPEPGRGRGGLSADVGLERAGRLDVPLDLVVVLQVEGVGLFSVEGRECLVLGVRRVGIVVVDVSVGSRRLLAVMRLVRGVGGDVSFLACLPK